MDDADPPGSSLTRSPETKSHAIAGIVLVGYEPPPTEYRTIPASEAELRFRHSSWRVQRQRVWDALLRTHASSRVLERFAECGANLIVMRRDDGNEHRLACDKCRSRYCQACGREQGAVLAENLATLCETDRTRFVTLTLRHNNLSLTDQLDRLYACFLMLRRRAFWKENCPDGAALVELKLSERTGRWHVHLHCLVHGRFIDQKKLSTEWLAVTGDSSIVDVRAVSDLGDVVRYVAKYVTKPLDASIFADANKLDEAIVALRGRRLCLTWGAWRGKPLREPPDDGHTWTSVGSLERWWDRLRHGDAEAAPMIQHLCLVCPATNEYFATKFGPSS